MIEIETSKGIRTVNLDTITLDELSEIISEMSVEVNVRADAKTVLYSGSINGYSSSDFLEPILGNLDKSLKEK